MKTWTLTVNLSPADYDRLRKANMRGEVDASFTSTDGGDVTFRTKNARKLCKQLESIIDPGATSWADIFDITHLLMGA